MATNLEIFKSPRFAGEVIQADIEFFDSLETIDRFARMNSSVARLEGIIK